MEYYSIREITNLWKVSRQMVMKYLKHGQIPGAILEEGAWKIPYDAVKPGTVPVQEEQTSEASPLLKKLLYQQYRNNHYGIYEYLLLNMAYSSNRMASNRLTRQQVQMVHRAHRIDPNFEPVKIDDVLEIFNHLNTTDFILKTCLDRLTVDYIKKIHSLLTYGTFFDQKKGNGVGTLRPKSIQIQGGVASNPALILKDLHGLTMEYEKGKADLPKILAFHVRFERIHPFSDYNGRVGRLIMLKECLRYGIDPFIIDDRKRSAYFHGIASWDEDPSQLTDIVLQAQQRFQNMMDTCNKFDFDRHANPRRML